MGHFKVSVYFRILLNDVIKKLQIREAELSNHLTLLACLISQCTVSNLFVMDDPLIALTLWQNDNRSKVKKPSKPHRVECPPVVLDSNKVAEGEEGRRSKKERARGSISNKKDQSQKKPSGGKKSSRKGGEELDNCFPCLPPSRHPMCT